MTLAGLYIVAIIGLTSLVISLIIWGLYLSAARKIESHLEHWTQQLKRSEQQIQTFGQGAILSCQKVQELEMKLKQFDSQQERYAVSNPEQATYAQATELAQMGAGIEELVHHCGISQAEAELIYLVNQKNTPAPIERALS